MPNQPKPITNDREAGKGSKQRPTDKKKYQEGWERIWGKKKKKNERN